MRIKEIRESKGISQRKAALEMNLSPVVYGRYENGLREPSNIVLISMADYFGVSVDELLGREAKTSGSLLSANEKSLIDDFRLLNQDGKDYIRQQMAIALQLYIQRDRDGVVENHA